MFKKLTEFRTELLKMKDEAEKAGNEELSSSLAATCVSLRAACENALGEGKTGVQNSSRSYASAKETQGHLIPKKEKNLLTPSGNK